MASEKKGQRKVTGCTLSAHIYRKAAYMEVALKVQNQLLGVAAAEADDGALELDLDSSPLAEGCLAE